MSKFFGPDIDDTQIRLIKAEDDTRAEACSRAHKRVNKPKVRLAGWIVLAMSLLAGAVALFFAVLDDSTRTHETTAPTPQPQPAGPVQTAAVTHQKANVSVTDTVAAGIGLTIVVPQNAVPSLRLGPSALTDTARVLVMPAAGVRADNGGVLGACVIDGTLVGRGERKTGYCAIIDGQLSLGAADASPLFEQAVETGGCFFRQYPLVVGGQPVVNRPKGRAHRKALAEAGGRIFVVLTKRRVTFAQFSEALAALGVSNAVNLDGGVMPGRWRGAGGEETWVGDRDADVPQNATFLVWQ